MREKRSAVLISTLGTEPQVLTLCLQELLARGEPITEAVGIHSRSGDPMVEAAVKRLREEWATLPFGEMVRLRLAEVPIADVDSKRALTTLYRHLKGLVASNRSQGFRLHINVSGGRKPMGICALLVAQLLFQPEDRLWYLVSSKSLVQSRDLVGDRHQYKLLEIPVPLWTEARAFLEVLTRYDDPWAAVEIQRRLKHLEEVERWRHFLQNVLTPAEREVIEELVSRGGTDRDIGEKLGKSPRTVGHQLSSAFRKAREFLGWPEGLRIDRTTLAALLAPYVRENCPIALGKSPEDGKLSNC